MPITATIKPGEMRNLFRICRPPGVLVAEPVQLSLPRRTATRVIR
jgi:hypothetical protein